MIERPILFNGEMVRAILDGRKTQTRRVMKPQPPIGSDGVLFNPTSYDPDYGFYFKPHGGKYKCPYGIPGDRLWVRETWREGYTPTKYSPGIIYQADKQKSLGMDEYSDRHKWKPSIYLKREHSRILLEITNIRVERVQDISFGDCEREGIECAGMPMVNGADREFKELWNSINEAKGFGWDQNPWVWVVEFRRIK